MEYDIVEMVRLDIGDVIELLKSCNLYYPEVDTPDNFERKLRLDKSLMLVARDKDRIIGFVMASYDGWVALVWHLGVLPAFRGQGVAKALITEIETRLKRRGANYSYGLVKLINTSMRSIISKWGYLEKDGVIVEEKQI